MTEEDFLSKAEIELEQKLKIPSNIWIVKPGEDTNRGFGINVCRGVNEVKGLVAQASYGKTTIIQ
jgi:hypothetical protein